MKYISNSGTLRHFNALFSGALVCVVLNGVMAAAAHAEAPNPYTQSTGESVTQHALPAGTLAIVNGVPVAQTQLDEAMRNVKQPDTPQLREVVKHDLVLRELLRQKAEEAQYGMKPEVEQAARAARINAETQLYLKDNVHPEAVTDEQMKARYDEIVASLGQQEYKSRIISVADDVTARKVLAQIKRGGAFDALASQYSVAPSRTSGGAMDWVSFRTPPVEGKTKGVPLPVAQALAKLPVGGVTPKPVVVGDLRVIIRLEDKRAVQVHSFDQLKDTIRQQLQSLAFQKAGAAFGAGLLKNATVVQ